MKKGVSDIVNMLVFFTLINFNLKKKKNWTERKQTKKKIWHFQAAIDYFKPDAALP